MSLRVHFAGWRLPGGASQARDLPGTTMTELPTTTIGSHATGVWPTEATVRAYAAADRYTFAADGSPLAGVVLDFDAVGLRWSDWTHDEVRAAAARIAEIVGWWREEQLGARLGVYNAAPCYANGDHIAHSADFRTSWRRYCRIIWDALDGRVDLIPASLYAYRHRDLSSYLDAAHYVLQEADNYGPAVLPVVMLHDAHTGAAMAPVDVARMLDWYAAAHARLDRIESLLVFGNGATWAPADRPEQQALADWIAAHGD